MRRFIALAAFLCMFALAQPAPVRQYLLRLEPVRKDFSLQNLTADERRIAGEHVVHLQKMQAEGKMMLAGQAFDSSRGFWGIVIVNTPDAETAKEWLNADPAVKQNMLRGAVIPFRTVLFRAPDPPAAAAK